jgi:hypothetical protein
MTFDILCLMKRLTLLSVLIGLVVPATSSAHVRRHHVTTDPVALALRAAEIYWKANPCVGTILVRIQSPPSIAIAESNGSPILPNEHINFWITTPVTTDPCVIYINKSEWPNWRADNEDFQWFCDGITHEIGHFLGHRDSGQTNPTSIEYPLLEPDTPNFNSVPQCRHFNIWYGHEHYFQNE